jgi:hypothetical protein
MPGHMFRCVMLTIGLTVSLAACSNAKAVKAMDDVANQMCACKPGDAKCLGDAQQALQDTAAKLKDEKGTDSDKKKIEAALKKATDCYEKNSGGGATGGDAPKADTK